MDTLLVQQIEDFKKERCRILGRLFKKSYQFIAENATEFLQQEGYAGFRLGHIILLINLDMEGSTINTLAQRIGITKQAVSKLVQELQESNFVETVKHSTDARAVIVKMTNEGATFLLTWKNCVTETDNKIAAIIGQEKLETLKDILEELVTNYEENSSKTPNMMVINELLANNYQVKIPK